jgi:hypothetical protein
MTNIKVTLVHTDAPADMKRRAARVIDGSLLKAASPEGRKSEAIALYNQMMGIVSTIHPYETVETDEPATPPLLVPESAVGKYQDAMEDKAMGKMANMLAAGIAKGVAEALAVQAKPQEKAAEAPSSPASEPVPKVATPQPQPMPVLPEAPTMRSTKRAKL